MITKPETITIRAGRDSQHCDSCAQLIKGHIYTGIKVPDNFDALTYLEIDVNGKNAYIDLTDETSYDVIKTDERIANVFLKL